MKKMLVNVLPFYKHKCLFCENEFDITYTLCRQHSITGIRFVPCKKCKTVNFLTDSYSLYDIDDEKFVSSKEGNHKYREGKFSFINMNNVHIVSSVIALLVIIIWDFISHR